MLKNSIAWVCSFKLDRSLVIFYPIFIFGIFFLFINDHCPHFLSVLLNEISGHNTTFLIFRWSLIGLFIFIWPKGISLVGRKFNIPPELIAYWQARKFFIAVWIALFELLIDENILVNWVHVL